MHYSRPHNPTPSLEEPADRPVTIAPRHAQSGDGQTRPRATLRSLAAVAALGAVLGVSRVSVPAPAPAQTALHAAAAEVPVVLSHTAQEATPALPVADAAPEPLTVLLPSGHWYVYPRGCETVQERRDVVIHFHGAHTTVIPRYLASGLDAVLVIINKGIGSGPYSRALALPSQVDTMLVHVEASIQKQCHLPDASITRLALSSWSAGYGAIQQILRLRPERVGAVLLADGLHVGFSDEKSRTVNTQQLDVFSEFARQAARGERLMSITHSAILPEQYASAAETALELSRAAHAPTWPVSRNRHGMVQVTEARRGQYYVEGYQGADKAAHAQHLYSIGRTSFTRLREYWER